MSATNQKTIQFQNFVAVHEDGEDVLGKVLYYSLSNILIDRERLSVLCDSVGFPYNPTKRVALADAFRSATGDIYERLVVRDFTGPKIIKVYCRDNKGPDGIISRELVKETVHENTNEYKKLANISLVKQTGSLTFDNLVSDEHVNPMTYCLEARQLFDLYQSCAGRRQIETLLENYVSSMQAVKISRGRIYFVPRDFMANLKLFEDFVELLEENNQYDKVGHVPLDANSMYVVDDIKQREKMASAFYRAVRGEIAKYEEQATHLIQSGSQSPAIMDRCILRIRGLEQKKACYEEILKRELNEVDDEFTSLRYLSDELQIRAKGLRFQKSAA